MKIPDPHAGGITIYNTLIPYQFRTGASALPPDVHIMDDDGHGADVENLPERDHGRCRNELRQGQQTFDKADAHGNAQPRERGDEIVAGMESEH